MHLSRDSILRSLGSLCPPGAVLVAALAFACGTPDANLPPLGDPGLEGVRVSERLAEAWRDALARLASGEAARGTCPPLDAYYDVAEGLYDPRTREVAADSLLVRWTTDARNVFWPELVRRERSFIPRAHRFDEIFLRPEVADSTTALGAYLHAWKAKDGAGMARGFVRANDLPDELDPVSDSWLELRAAFGRRIAGHPEESVDRVLAALGRARAAGGPRLEAQFWNEIARARWVSGAYEDALLAVSMADTLAALGRPRGGAVFDRLSNGKFKLDILTDRAQFDAAQELCERLIEVASSRRNFFYVSYYSNRLGMITSATGDLESGLRAGQLGWRLAVEDEDYAAIPRHLMNVARRFLMLGQLDSCRVYQGRAIEAVRAYPRSDPEGRLPLMLMEYYAQVGQYDVVDSLSREVLARADVDRSREAEAELHLELIRAWMELDRPDLVYRSLEAVESNLDGVADSFADRNVPADLNLRSAEFFIQRGEHARAAEALDRAEMALEGRENLAKRYDLHRARGRLAQLGGDFDGAKRQFERCIEISRRLRAPEKVSTSRFHLASTLLEEARFDEARAALPQEEEQEIAIRFTTRILSMLLTGVSYREEGRFDEALKSLRDAREACPAYAPQEILARIALEQGRVQARLGRADRARAELRGAAAHLDAGMGQAPIEELAFLHGNLRRDLVEAWLRVPGAAPEPSLEFARGVLAHWRAAEDDGPLHAPQLLYFVGDETSVRWTVSARGLTWSRLPGRDAIRAALAPVLADGRAPGREVSAAESRKLAEMLLAGVETQWPRDAVLALVPDLALSMVPWSALPLPGSDDRVLDHGTIVVYDAPVGRAGTDATAAPSGALLAIGTNANAGRDLEMLRHAEEEAREVADLWPGVRAVSRVGDEGRGTLESPGGLRDYQAIHVASHAVVYDGRDDNTMLVLPGEQDRGITAEQIRGLDLEADLVFLSSCEAGDGQGTRSIHAGIARAFLRAGARCVIAPLAPVDDEAARLFAREFYAQWSRAGSVEAALRETQRAFRGGDPRWTHPFYWAFYQPFRLSSGR